MRLPRVEDVDTVICADGQVRFGHSLMGVRFERLLSPDSVSFMDTLSGCRGCSREATTVGAGSSASAAEQAEQYFSPDSLPRSESLPQRSQYFVSNTSKVSGWTAGMLCAALFLMFLCGLMRAC